MWAKNLLTTEITQARHGRQAWVKNKGESPCSPWAPW